MYLVNLQHHRGRRLKTLAHLKSFGVSPTVFEASDGYVPPLLSQYDAYSRQELGSMSYFADFNQVEINRNQLFIDSPGAFGYIDTYIRILKDAKSKGYQSIIILEDDVLLSSDFNERLKVFCSKLPDTWKFIGLGASQYGWDSVNLDKARSKGFYTPKQLDTCGSFAIAIRDSIFDELIQLQSHFEAPFDHLPLGEIYNNYPSDCFVAFPYLVMPDVRSSSIRGSRNQLVHANRMLWDPSLFEYPLKRPILNFILTSKEQIKYLDTFSEEVTFPFELHLFVPSLDGLRPYHSASQAIEIANGDNEIYSPNSGYCVKSKTNTPFTEDGLISLYESLQSKRKPTADFEIIDTITHKIDSDRISVIIPTYKRAELLTIVILSVIEQDYKNKEIIVVDDNPRGSEDQVNTERIVLRLIKEHADTNLIYVSHNQNRNGAGARNTGFLKSTGSYICFLDDDDLYLQGRLSLSVDKLKGTPRYIGAVYCGFEGGNSAARTNERYKEGNLTQELLSLNYLEHFLNSNTATYKRDALITVNGFDETFRRHQDLEINLRFFEHYEMSVVTKQLVSIRPNPTTTNNQQYGIDLFETKLKFLKKFKFIINRFDMATQKSIYDKHWLEVIKYVPNEKPFEKYLLSKLGNGHLQCFIRLNKGEVSKASKIIATAKSIVEEKKISSDLSKKKEAELTSKSEIAIEKDEPSISIVEGTYISPANGTLSFWQIKGANAFGVVFSRFIQPHHRIKLKNQPKAFFYDSKNDFTRFVGRLLKII